MNKYELLEYANAWNPSFKSFISVNDCADQINKPHEDYPTYVDRTAYCISNVVDCLNSVGQLTKLEYRSIHGFVFSGHPHLEPGKFRNINVRSSSGMVYPDQLFINELFDQFHGLSIGKYNTIDELIQWYKIFETIHPFEDGNGRVGGIVVAAVSYCITGEYLTPCQ